MAGILTIVDGDEIHLRALVKARAAVLPTQLQVLIAYFEGEATMVPRNAEWVNVESVEEAAKKVRECIDENDLGMRDWFGGIVRDEKKNPVVVVQYNGRVLTPEEDAQFIKNAGKLMKKP